MAITVNIYYSGANGNAKKTVKNGRKEEQRL